MNSMRTTRTDVPSERHELGHLVPRPSFQLATVPLFLGVAPLLEEERDASLTTLIPNVLDPVAAQPPLFLCFGVLFKLRQIWQAVERM